MYIYICVYIEEMWNAFSPDLSLSFFSLSRYFLPFRSLKSRSSFTHTNSEWRNSTLCFLSHFHSSLYFFFLSLFLFFFFFCLCNYPKSHYSSTLDFLFPGERKGSLFPNYESVNNGIYWRKR